MGYIRELGLVVAKWNNISIADTKKDLQRVQFKNKQIKTSYYKKKIKMKIKDVSFARKTNKWSKNFVGNFVMRNYAVAVYLWKKGIVIESF